MLNVHFNSKEILLKGRYMAGRHDNLPSFQKSGVKRNRFWHKVIIQ